MFLNDIATWPTRLTAGADLAKELLRTTKLPASIQKIAFVGMGGSGIAGRIIQELVSSSCRLPIFIVDSPEIPAHFDEHTLTFAISYSGNTWETLEALEQLVARAIPTIIMTHGGKAQEIALTQNIPCVTIPSAQTPRSSLGYMLGFLLQFFNDLGFYPGITLINQFIQHAHKQIPLYRNQEYFDDFLARAKYLDFFHIWGISGYGSACAYRAQTQFNENSKIPAVHSSLPELAHNLLVGFTAPSDNSFVLLLSPNNINKNIKDSIERISTIIRQRGALLYKPTLLGDNLQVQLFDMILWADFASYHLGMVRGIDVAAVEIIDLLKKTHGQKLLD